MLSIEANYITVVVGNRQKTYKRRQGWARTKGVDLEVSKVLRSLNDLNQETEIKEIKLSYTNWQR